jgi:uncharacterized protein YqgC (DUF456 family)
VNGINPIFLVAYALMFLGLIGAVLPIVPGPLLIWLGVLIWAWSEGFQRIGWPTLLVLGLLTAIAWASDLLLTTLITRRAGVSWKAVAGAILGGLAGGLFLGGWIPVVGTVLSTIAGGVVGILVVETLDKQDWRLGLRAGRGYVLGYLASSILEAWLAFLMILLFLWQAFV